ASRYEIESLVRGKLASRAVSLKRGAGGANRLAVLVIRTREHQRFSLDHLPARDTDVRHLSSGGSTCHQEHRQDSPQPHSCESEECACHLRQRITSLVPEKSD